MHELLISQYQCVTCILGQIHTSHNKMRKSRIICHIRSIGNVLTVCEGFPKSPIENIH